VAIHRKIDIEAADTIRFDISISNRYIDVFDIKVHNEYSEAHDYQNSIIPIKLIICSEEKCLMFINV